MKSHLRNPIAVLLTLFVLGLTVFGPLCGTACASGAKSSCCDDGGASRCSVPRQAAANDAGCGHAVVMTAERVEQPVIAAAVAFVAMPVGVEFAQPRVVSVNLRSRAGDLPPPRWFDPLLVSLRL